MDIEHAHVARCADLLAGLQSTRLTYLNLTVDAVPPKLKQQIARFRDLEVLELRSPHVSSKFLKRLSRLPCLTWLGLTVGQGQRRRADVAAVRAQAAQLKAAILERARLVGVPSEVCMPGLVDDDVAAV